MIVVAAGEQVTWWSDEPPIGPQDAQQLRRQHHVPVLAALAAADRDHPASAVDILEPQADHLRGPQPYRIGRGQCGPALQARHRFQEAHHLVGAQHHRQLAGLAGMRDALGNGPLAERHAIEEPQRADDLVQRRPGDPASDKMHLESSHLLQPEPVRRASEIAAELFATAET